MPVTEAAVLGPVGAVNRDGKTRGIGFLEVVALAEAGTNEPYAAGECLHDLVGFWLALQDGEEPGG